MFAITLSSQTNLDESVESSLEWLLDRNEGQGAWIDTRIGLRELSGGAINVPNPTEAGIIFGWVQGRALESLAGHLEFLEDGQLRDRCRSRLEHLARWVVARIQTGQRHHFFAMDQAGNPTPGWEETFGAGERITLTDLFIAKGLLLAGLALQDAKTCMVTGPVYRSVLEAVKDGRLLHDQISFDPRNPAAGLTEGTISIGPAMLMLGAEASLAKYPQNPDAVTRGMGWLVHLKQLHLNTDKKWTDVSPNAVADVVADGSPYDASGRFLMDPGHTIELCGFGLKLLHHASQIHGLDDAEHRYWSYQFGDVLLAAWTDGFCEPPGGVVKSIDAVTGDHLNPTFPWWSLAEAMRACAYAAVNPNLVDAREEFERILSVAQQCLFSGYASPAIKGLFYQSLNADGSIGTTIPAVPDIDPLYHTNLCFIDILKLQAS